jgi:hypothetical protein
MIGQPVSLDKNGNNSKSGVASTDESRTILGGNIVVPHAPASTAGKPTK